MKHVRDLVKDLPPFESCANCVGGWVMSEPAITYTPAMKETRYRRCGCWHAHQQKIVEAIAAKGKQKR